MTLAFIGRWPKCALPLRCATRQGARRLRWASDRGFRFAAVAASSTHGYALAAAYAALLYW
ncbi:MAG: hypothetical protein IKP00_06075 [Victivallales bacterium]|nr:hypothetical protein [Victivallales bacterium]